MEVKALNLNEIQDEVLDDIFGTEEEIVEDEEFKIPNHETITESNEELVYLIQQNINSEKNKEKLIKKNAGLVYSIAHKCTCHIPLKDKVMYGYEGLLNALKTFDLSEGNKFTTYAYHPIKQYMYMYGNRDSRTIDIPDYLAKQFAIAKSYINSQFPRYPKANELVEVLGITEHVAETILYNIPTKVSLTRTYDDEQKQESVLDRIPSSVLNEDVLENKLLDHIDLVLDRLDEHERVLLSCIHGLDGYEVYTYPELIKSGYIDGNGQWVTSTATMSRRYNSVIDKVKRIAKELNLT